ncbi:MAG: hypothetical protein FWG25_01755, partial [Promicromonosporaceae bacterium]|nr:hypothetical protein [Promicromonosporaceae bacterium]
MTMIDTLFGLIPAASTGQQWVARELQVINWGGYHGHHRLLFADSATLLAGASGSGKSTLMDAYIALLMPHTTPFNGASNGGVIGRPRGKEQRNVISYARGKLDEARTEEGTRERVLRGSGRDTWTAVALTWADQGARQFTAVRAWYVPANATQMDQVTAVRATCSGPFDLAELEEIARNGRLNRTSLTALGLTVFDTDREFAARMYATLGIGAAGGGDKAVELLARIQAGQQITTVDQLYKSMVLEEPDTLTKAADVVEHFDKLSETREQMLTAQAQQQTLAHIRNHREQIAESEAQTALIESLGSPTDAASPLGLWRADRTVELLRAIEDELREGEAAAASEVRRLEDAVAGQERDLNGAQRAVFEAGGDTVANAERELDTAERELTRVTHARERLDRALNLVGAEVSSAKQFAQVQQAARATLADSSARHQLFVARDEARDRMVAAEREVGQLTAERESLAKRRGNIPEPLHRARVQLAHAAGLDPADLPFVGELIEVQTERERWREAFNLALGGFATTVLLDAAHLPAFRAAIDAVPLKDRVRFEGAAIGIPSRAALDSTTLPGRLDYAPSPFEGWLRERLADRFAFVCVDDAAALSRYPKAVTQAGQVAGGTTGAHGGHGRANVLGFTNERRLAQLDREIAATREELRLAGDAFRGAEQRLLTAEQVAAAHRTIAETSWDDVDVETARTTREHWREVIARAKADNPMLDELQRRVANLRTALADSQGELGVAKHVRDNYRAQWESISEQVDAAQATLDDATEAGTVLGDDQRGYLDAIVAGVEEGVEGASSSSSVLNPTEAMSAFTALATRVSDRLRTDLDRAALTARTSTEALAAAFERFVSRWPDPNLGTDPITSFRDFERILTDLETHRLGELADDWRR